MITERLMKPGRFDVRLVNNAPYSVWSAVQEFDHIVITPGRLMPFSGFADADILARSIYTGVVTGKPTATSFTGQGLAYWLGTDQGTGDLLDSAVTNTAGTLDDWITDLLPSAITKGTVTNTGNTLTWTAQWTTRREAIDFAARSVGAEWRVQPDGTLDAAASSTLFVATPTAVITRNADGSEGGYTGIGVAALNRARDIDGYTTKVIVVGKVGDGADVATGSATTSTSYKDFHNNDVVFERLVNSPDVADAAADSVATNTLNLFSSIRRGVALSSATYAVPLRVAPGDWVYVFDKPAGLFDSANQIMWRGELINPIKLRCKGYTWPIQRGMGVYARRSGGTPTYTDLTDYVQWETGPTEWFVGTSIADPDQDPAQLSAAYLGANPDVVARVNVGDRVDYTPTWSGTISNGTLTATYQRLGDWCRAYYALTWGGTTSHAAATQTLTLPFTAAVTNGTAVGTARIVDSSTGNNYARTVVTATTGTVAFMDDAGAFVTNLVPMTWASGDQLLITLDFPI